MNRLLIFLFIGSLPFLLLVTVNEVPNNPAPTHKLIKDRCTRYCHDVSCPHWKASYAEEPTLFKRLNKNVFDAYVTGLHNNPLGVNYGVINILVFIILYPLIGGILLWRIIKYYIR